MTHRSPEYIPCAAPAQDTTPWVLLRGLAREQRHWGRFPQQLADRLQCRVICPDTPGNGYRYGEKSPLDIVLTLERVRCELATSGPFQLLGLSMGGMIATEWARLYPEQIERLVLVNSSFGNLSPPWQRLRPSALRRIASSLSKPVFVREKQVFEMICQRRDDLEACVAQWAIYARECPVSRANLGRQLFAAARYRGPRNPPTQDTLILNAQGDQLVNPGCSSSIARHWGVPLKTHPWAGHDLTHDAPEWVIDRLANPLPDMN